MRIVKLLMALLALVATTVLSGGLAHAAVGDAHSAHSHWDDPNRDYEIKTCYDILASNTGTGATIAYLPVREQDAKNYYQVSITKTGFAFSKRVAGTTYAMTPTTQPANPPAHAVGDDVMFDFTEVGNVFTIYGLNADDSRGALMYQWSDTTNVGGVAPYLQGVNISYYTTPHWEGTWSVRANPLDGVGVGHVLGNLAKGTVLLQDARNTTSVCGTDATTDDPTPADGSVTGTGLNGLPSGQTTINWGLASGANYTYVFTVSGAASGSYFDFRDPNPPGNTSYFGWGYYRLKLGTASTHPTIQRYASGGTTACAAATSTASTTTTSSSFGGSGTYTLQLVGSTMTLKNGAGTTILTVNEPAGDPTTGVRVRLHPVSGETWTWTGTVN